MVCFNFLLELKFEVIVIYHVFAFLTSDPSVAHLVFRFVCCLQIKFIFISYVCGSFIWFSIKVYCYSFLTHTREYCISRDMVHLAIDGMWQIFKLQRSTLRNGFCRIAAKSGILLRLINTLYSLNEATRLASITVGAGYPVDGLTQRPRSGQLDPSHPIFSQYEASFPMPDQPDLLKVKHGIVDHHPSSGPPEPSRASTSHSQRSDANQSENRRFSIDADRPQSSNATNEALGSKPSELASLDKVLHLASKESSGLASKEHENVDRWRTERMTNSNRTSTDRPPKLVEPASNGFPTTLAATQQEQVRPLLSLLDKEPPSRHFSGQLEYMRQLSGLERHETIMPLLHASNEKKINGEHDFLMAEFAGEYLCFCEPLSFFLLTKTDRLCVYWSDIIKLPNYCIFYFS